MFQSILDHCVDPSMLWTGEFKIPWNDPEFSVRMLREHLSADHHLASRKQKLIDQQVRWLHTHLCGSIPGSILDLGCGPGLYASGLHALGHTYRGIDVSPASIAYARQNSAQAGSFVEGDIRTAEFGDGYDAVSFIYGEFNVFSEADQLAMLRRIWQALRPGGRIALEPQRFEAVKDGGTAPSTWYRSGDGLAGLFGDQRHLVLQGSHWFEDQQVAVQVFFVLDPANEEVTVYCNTTRAISEAGMTTMLQDAGFDRIQIRDDWPVPNDSLYLITASKPE